MKLIKFKKQNIFDQNKIIPNSDRFNLDVSLKLLYQKKNNLSIFEDILLASNLP